VCGGAAGGLPAGGTVFRVRRAAGSGALAYDFRAVTDADLALLDGWHHQPHVREWWGAPEPFPPEDLSDPRLALMIVGLRGTEFAFMQDYDVHGWEGHHFAYLPPGARGIDQFIGVPELLGQGHGPAFIRQRVTELFAAGAPAIGTDPHPGNLRAIKAYAKAGFQVVGPEEETEWGRVIRMEAWRP
jgi:aminoglycoside 6'-N-acetyltransferase